MTIYAKEFISQNWQTMDDEQLALQLNCTAGNVKKMRTRLRIRRNQIKTENREFIAKVCEYYANDINMVKIAKLFGKNPNKISQIITKYWFRIKKSENTITLILGSRAND